MSEFAVSWGSYFTSRFPALVSNFTLTVLDPFDSYLTAKAVELFRVARFVPFGM